MDTFSVRTLFDRTVGAQMQIRSASACRSCEEVNGQRLAAPTLSFALRDLSLKPRQDGFEKSVLH